MRHAHDYGGIGDGRLDDSVEDTLPGALLSKWLLPNSDECIAVCGCSMISFEEVEHIWF